jgi:hypothetical protein
MTPEELALLERLPTMIILIYLLYKERQTVDKLLERILEQSKEHANNLVQMALTGLDRREEGK